MVILVQFGFTKSSIFFIAIVPYDPMLKLCPSVAAILAFGWTQNHTFCKGMSMAHSSQFAFKCLVVSDENNFTVSP
jgi:hypothetical protein